jgi:hypothetical protein
MARPESSSSLRIQEPSFALPDGLQEPPRTEYEKNFKNKASAEAFWV